MNSTLAKRSRIRRTVGIAALAGGLLVAFWLWPSNREKADAHRATRSQPVPHGAELWTVEWTEVPEQVVVTGTVTSDQIVQISARIQAHVTAVHASAGDPVEEGTMLLQLDDRDLRAERAAADANLHRTRTEYNRLRSLRDARAATEQEVTAAEAAYRTAQARLDQVDVMLTHTEVTSPLTGLVADRAVEAGSLVYPGQRLFTVYDTTQMRFDAAVPGRLVDFLQAGDAVALQFASLPDSVSGHVHRLVAEKDPQTRTRTVQIMMEETDRPLLPGTFGRLLLTTGVRTVIQVPQDAIHRVGQLEKVFLVINGQMQTRLVKTGQTTDGLTEILSGLTAGEVVLANAEDSRHE